MQYEDFDISIEAAGGRTYQVVVLHSPAGEAREMVDFPFDDLKLKLQLSQLENALLKSSGRSRREPSKTEQPVLAFGQALFEFLMHGEVGRRYAVSYDRCQQAGKGLRLKLRIQDPLLAALPWEFLYDQRFDHYLVLSQRTPLLRYLDLPRPLRPLHVTPPLRMLGMVASPNNLPRLDVAVEKARVEEALRDLRAGGLVELTWLEGQGWRDLQRAMRRGPWHLFHFIGHGGFDKGQQEGYLVFADRQGEAARMSATNLARLLGDHNPLRVVLLNSCEGGQSSGDVFSSTASTLVRSGIPCVVAMQYEITDAAAVEFARTFYESLADGLPTETAVSDARKSIAFSRQNSLEWGTPVIFTHAPDGVLFTLAEAVAATSPPESTASGTPAAAGRGPAEKPTPRPPAPQPRPALAAPPTGITIPHLVTGAAPLKIDWCWIPAGSFTMGGELYSDEKPVHQLHVEGFWLARYPVTNAQYRLFIDAGGYDEQRWWSAAGWQQRQGSQWREPRFWQDAKWNGAQRPVVGVSWYEAMAFCAWAAATTGEGIRLPGEAEWEKAARGTDGRTFPWGEAEPDDKLCNFNNKVGQTTPVGQYSPQGDSPYGIADMAGNVWEWTADWFQAYPGNTVPNDAYGEKYRVRRGGSWFSNRDSLRCAIRNWGAPDNWYNYVGFRCASTAF